MSKPRVSLMEVHSALSHLIFAVSEAMEPYCVDVRVSYNKWTYITLSIECYVPRFQLVVDRLKHGILWGDYNYRFKMIGHPPIGDIQRRNRWDTVVISASPDMSFDDKLFKETAA